MYRSGHLLLLLLLVAGVANAQVDVGALDQIQRNLESASNAWRGVLEGYALSLLVALAVIGMAWQAILMALRYNASWLTTSGIYW